ncbi:hypothetical protein ACP275_04G152000 [Erythranthe tilingii]
MAAYAAIVSLVQILHPDQFPLRLRTPEIESLYNKVISLQSILEKIFPITKNIRQQVIDLNGRIREAIYRAQDEVESFIIKHSLSSEHILKEIIEEIDPLAVEADKIASSIKKEMVSSSAVDSLTKLLNPDSFPVDHLESQLESSEYEKLESDVQCLYEKICSLQSCLDKICAAPVSITVEVNELDIQIKAAAEDTIKSFHSSQTDSDASESETEDPTPPAFLQDLQEITANIEQLAEKAQKIADSINEDHPKAQDPLSENAQQSSKRDFRPKKKRIIGQKEDFEKLKEEILKEKNDSRREVLPIVGLPGSGKTTLARSLYEESSITDEFEIHGWVTVTQDYQLGEIFSKLFHSLETKGQKKGEAAQSEKKENLQDAVYKSLRKKKYVVVVDDMWSEDVWDKVKSSFPDDSNGSRIVLTTRSNEIAKYAKASSDFLHRMKPLSLEHSWELLTLTVFEEDPCPPHLKDIGWEISKNCRGLPLSLTVIGGLLSQENKTEEYWKNIQGDTLDAAAKGDEAYVEILFLSYNHLPGKLKGCFLYMGAFQEDSEIPVTKLIRLWVAEGFLKPSSLQIVEEVANHNLEQLINRNLLDIRKSTSNGQIKACGMHDTLRELSVKECGNEKFFHSRRKYVQTLEEGTNTQRRISVHRNILMCLEQVHNSVKEIAFARTILYAGAHHHHPLPFCLTFDRLRVLDAFTVYFIEFPDVILQLIHLSYLSLTYNGKLPSKLSNLEKLQVLIVRQHPKIIFLGTSILPDEIWGMTHLRHLLFTESDLPKIPSQRNSILLANLQTLSNVSAASCTKEVLENMPNLTKLAMWTESPGPVGLYLDQVKKLVSFKFTVLKPIPKKKVEFMPELYFPPTLVKLRLSGCSLPWEVMTVIGQLPFLEVLKLREIAFEGGNWSPKKREFVQLKFLLLEYLDLKKWEADHTHFRNLERLIMRHCYELEKIPEKFVNLGCLELIELVDCSPGAVNSAEEVKESLKKRGINTKLKIHTYSSWK